MLSGKGLKLGRDYRKRWQLMNKICAVINTLNEEHNIEACIKSLGPIGKYVDHVLVCDNLSDDATVEIARKCGAEVIQHPRQRMVTISRRYAYEHCDAEWIFAFDADERPAEALLRELRALSERDDIDVVRFAKKQYLFGKFMMHGGWHEAFFCQFFRRKTYVDNYRTDMEGAHHDFAAVQGLPKTHLIPKGGDAYLVHYAYDDVETFVHRTLGRYGFIEAGDRLGAGESYSWWKMVKAPLKEFWLRFVRVGGYKDGMHGFVLALLMACYRCIIEMNKWFLATQPKKHTEGDGVGN
jgi:glycosyltransferase involved in cell wall biosynthesis